MMGRKFYQSIVLLSLCVLLASCGRAPVAHANKEELQGHWSDQSQDVAEFLGVPFAQPPIGSLRWSAPQPNVPRFGRQPAKQFAAACMQGRGNTEWYADIAEAFGNDRSVAPQPLAVSEDCLYLNIWSPGFTSGKKISATLPVMVWFHGGGNTGGWPYEPNYLGAKLAAHGAVVVSAAYRLGPLGFFSHPGLSNNDALANFGLLDNVAALKWVQNNISAFGGDAANVTCFGESAGAANIGIFISEYPGLCTRIIAQSSGGDFVELETVESAQESGRQLATTLGITNDADAMTHLRDVPAQEILDAAVRSQRDFYRLVEDDKSVKSAPLAAALRNDSASVDLLIGTNRDEWLMYLEKDIDDADVGDWLDTHAADNKIAVAAAVASEPDSRHALDKLETAEQMLCPSLQVAAAAATNGARVWVYEFTRQRSGRGGELLGAYHGAEIPYVFDNHDNWLPTDAADRKLTSEMMAYWLRFARSGDPNGPDAVAWPLYKKENGEVLELGRQLFARPSSATTLCEALASN